MSPRKTKRDIAPAAGGGLRLRAHPASFLCRRALHSHRAALTYLLERDGVRPQRPRRRRCRLGPHFAPRAKSVIFLFMYGVAGHTFDYKPELQRRNGQKVKIETRRHAFSEDAARSEEDLRAGRQVGTDDPRYSIRTSRRARTTSP